MYNQIRTQNLSPTFRLLDMGAHICHVGRLQYLINLFRLKRVLFSKLLFWQIGLKIFSVDNWVLGQLRKNLQTYTLHYHTRQPENPVFHFHLSIRCVLEFKCAKTNAGDEWPENLAKILKKYFKFLRGR